MMNTQIPNGRRTTYPVNKLMGGAALTLAVASWFAYRATRWEQISTLTAAVCFFNLVAGLGGLLPFFVPSLFGSGPLPPVQLLVSIVQLLLGIAFTYFYQAKSGWRLPLETQ